MKNFFRNNGLSIVLLACFLMLWGGQYATGWAEHNEDQREHGRPQLGFFEYAGESHFLEATFENWESEFLQMAVFVVFTVFLYQKGSAESKDPNKNDRVDKIMPGSKNKAEMPWPVRRGGFALRLYSYSLSLALALLFLGSFLLHGIGGLSEYNQGQMEHGRPAGSLLDYMTSSAFWFQSFQNWQSEFLAIAVMVVFSIFLRQKGSPESKPVDTPHGEHAAG